MLCSDIAAERLDAIEAALERPGKQGLAALLKLRRSSADLRSSLEPPGGLPPLTEAGVPYEDIPMPSRREMLDAGERLRASDPFAGLSAGEATALRRLMEPCEVAAGDAVVRQGDEGGSLFVIEAGEAEVHVTDAAGRTRVARTLRVGDHFGEISLLGSRARTADVLALTSL